MTQTNLFKTGNNSADFKSKPRACIFFAHEWHLCFLATRLWRSIALHASHYQYRMALKLCAARNATYKVKRYNNDFKLMAFKLNLRLYQIKHLSLTWRIDERLYPYSMWIELKTGANKRNKRENFEGWKITKISTWDKIAHDDELLRNNANAQKDNYSKGVGLIFKKPTVFPLINVEVISLWRGLKNGALCLCNFAYTASVKGNCGNRLPPP